MDQGILGIVANVITIITGVVAIVGTIKFIQKKAPDIFWKSQLKKFLRSALDELGASLATGTSQIQLRDLLFENSLFIQPRWEYYGGIKSTGALIDYLRTCLRDGEKVLIVGESGQGKSTVMRRLFASMANEFLHRRSRQAPLYVRLHELYAFTNEAMTLETLWLFLTKDSLNPFPLSFKKFANLVRSKKIVLLLDGLDEVQGTPDQNLINQVAGSKLFSFTSVLSSRITFYESYLRISQIQATYHKKVRLKNLDIDQINGYIDAFCQRAGIANSQAIVQAIADSSALMEITKRTLLLVMVLDMISQSGLPEKSLKSTAELYDEYTNRWLMTEEGRPGVLIRKNEKHFLMELIAWEMQKQPMEASGGEGNFSASISRDDLILLLDSFREQPIGNAYKPQPPAVLLEDIVQRTFLVPSKNSEEFYFSHKSFQEFYASKYVFRKLKSNPQAAERVLSEHLPVEIASYLKEMLKSGNLRKSDKTKIGKNLENAYTNNIQSTNILLREQASYYLASLGTQKAIRFLKKIISDESEKFVQRGILVGLAIQCQLQESMKEYIESLQRDEDADSINLGYHLIYYGDSPFENDYRDIGLQKCDGTIRAIVRHLQDEKYTCGWVLDLYTLRRLIETRGKEVLSGRELQRVQDFLRAPPDDQSGSFLNEINLLKERIGA